jgi:hypothetical protein
MSFTCKLSTRVNIQAELLHLFSQSLSTHVRHMHRFSVYLFHLVDLNSSQFRKLNYHKQFQTLCQIQVSLMQADELMHISNLQMPFDTAPSISNLHPFLAIRATVLQFS